jgi:hypothetical protein
MKLVKTIPHLGGLPEIFVFYCSRCKQAETKEQAVKCERLGAGRHTTRHQAGQRRDADEVPSRVHFMPRALGQP